MKTNCMCDAFVIYLLPFPFGKRDYDRFGVETFVNSGFDVQVWDMTDYFVPGYRQRCGQVPDFLEFSGLRQFHNIDAILEAIGALSSKAYVFSFLEQGAKSYPILLALSGRRIPYVRFSINSLPDFAGEVATGSLTDRLRTLTASLKLRVKTLDRERIRHYVFRLSTFWKSGIAPPNLLVVDGEKSYRAAVKSKVPQSDIVKAHTLDYDLFLNIKDLRTRLKESTAVFIDEFFPFHPDHFYMKVVPCVTADVYYPLLRRFFDEVETSLDLRVKIAAHPRSCYDNTEKYFGDREVIWGQTVELVRDASLVLLTSSTAVNFAVLFQKPMLFITTNQINLRYARLIKAMVANLDAPILNLDESITIQPELLKRPSVDNYGKYKNEFIKMADSPDEFFWDIIKDALQINRGCTRSDEKMNK